MATKLIVLSTLVLFSFATVRADFFSDLFANAKHLLDDAHQSVLKVVGVKTDEQFQQKALEQGNAFAGKLDTWTKDTIKQTASLKDNEHVKVFREEVDKQFEAIKVQFPGTTADVKTFSDKAQKGADDILAKLQSAKDSEEGKQFQDLSKSLEEKTLETFKNFS